MGEVYHARDTKLDRDVAIKVLPDAFAHDADRLARFAREAKTLASLNHPHIAAIHGLEESSGVTALIMEFVEGEDLARRIACGAIPLDEALPIARQMAEALECAHELGIVHRDLKPANVVVRGDGTVKVLDFGLAKALDPAGASASSVSLSPTITSPAMTHAGVILGTAAYMAPEQARGKVVDKRADIWAFGVVLFEMLTGRRLFAGEEVSDTLALVLTREPDWSSLPAATPRPIVRLLRRCLVRDRAKRLADMSDARLDIDEALTAPAGEVTATAAPPSPMWLRMMPWTMAAAAAALAIAMLVLWAPWRIAPLAPSVQVRAELGAPGRLNNAAGGVALSPDGSTLAFVATTDRANPATLHVRRLDQLNAVSLPGTDGAIAPFFSPDGQWIAFTANRILRKVPASGGPVVSLGEQTVPIGGWWDEGNTIVLGGMNRGLVRVPAAGGQPQALTTLTADDRGHVWPQVLPGGRGILYGRVTLGNQTAGSNTIAVRGPAGESHDLLQGAYYARYLPSGHLVFVRNGAVFAAPFDLGALALRGEPAPVLESVAAYPNTGGAMIAIAQNGTLAYVPSGGLQGNSASVMWLERTGATRPLRAAPAAWGAPRFSPDGRRLAMTISDGRQLDVWVYDWERDIPTRVTADSADDGNPIWTPDGTGLVFSSMRSGVNNLYWQRADGTGPVQRLTESGVAQVPNSFHPNGKLLAFHAGNPATGEQSIMILPVERDEHGGLKGGAPPIFVGPPFLKSNAAFSPDGAWVAYAANVTDRYEIYVQPFPGPGARVQVSSGGGNRAVWSPAGREIFFAGAGGQQHMMVAPYTIAGATFVPEKPRQWSESSFSPAPPFGFYGPGFDIHPDGKRFAVAPAAPETTSDAPSQLVMIFNFLDEVRRRVSVR